MAGEPSADLRSAAGLARLAASDLGSQAALALDALARTLDLEALAAEDLPLLGENPFGALSGQVPGGGGGREPSLSAGDRAPEGIGGLRPRATPPPVGRGGASTRGEVSEDWGDPRRSAAAAMGAAGPGGAAPPVEASGRVAKGEAFRGADALGAVPRVGEFEGVPGASALEGVGLERLVAVVGRTAGGLGSESARVPSPAGSHRAEGTSRPPVPPRAFASEGGVTEAAPGDAGGRTDGGFESKPRAARTAGESPGPERGASTGLGSLWSQLAGLAEEAMRAGGGQERNPVAGVPPGTGLTAGGAPALPDDQASSSGPPRQPGEAPGEAGASSVAQAGRVQASALFNAARPAVAAAAVPVHPRAEASGPAPLDGDALAELVNDVLVRQARRHGVDLS